MRLQSFLLWSECLSKKISYTYKIDDEDKRRRDRCISRKIIQMYMQCSFEHLYQSYCNQLLFNVTGHEHTSFSKLLDTCKPVYDIYIFFSCRLYSKESMPI